ncbi:MAG: agmatine deiminase family protein [Gammaproteobacteria bacterium]|nr:agmatine deiminase family protein [Gammaproteobacteria bacterium]
MPNDFFLPAEWATQDAVLLAWPHLGNDWHSLLPSIEMDFLQLAQSILQYESLLIICCNKSHRKHIESLLGHSVTSHPVKFFTTDYNDTWCRDFGPITIIKNGQPVLLDFQFNGWGNRYDATLDNLITQKLQQKNYFAAPRVKTEFILEGGSIESDGAGTLLTTESCLLNSNRNKLGKPEIEALLNQYLNVHQILWLKYGNLDGDDTDSHIDNLARFVAQDTIAFLSCENTGDGHYSELQSMHDELRAFKQADGKPYRLLPLPLPDPVYSKIDNRRLAASYLNFLIINNAVLVPKFNCATDLIAHQAIQQCFPDRKMIAVDSRGFIEQNGGIHCLTMQLPLGTFNKDC